ncbi:MAG: hypothetical protein IH604_16955 [Burkholderiales bacterium]|nr:hypothetical protein [Burkholderiales bacterium]
METLLIYSIVLLSVTICAFAGFWFFGAAREHRQNVMPSIAPEIGRRGARNIAWDRAVRSARNRNR